MHPDQATDSIVDISLKHSLNFAVVPCCVFGNLFDRKLKSGERVMEYHQYIQYIQERVEDSQKAFIDIKGRDIVLYRIHKN